MNNNRTIALILIIFNLVMLAAAVHYQRWFNLDNPETTLEKYISSIKSGERQLTARLIGNFNWLNYKKVDVNKYAKSMVAVSRLSLKQKLGRVLKISPHKTGKTRVSYDVSLEKNNRLVSGRITLRQGKNKQWKVVGDSLLLNI